MVPPNTMVAVGRHQRDDTDRLLPQLHADAVLGTADAVLGVSGSIGLLHNAGTAEAGAMQG